MFFSDQGFFKKTNENMSHTSKNEFIRSFFGESSAWQFAFEINWPLRAMSIRHLIFNHFSLECDLIWDYSWLKKVTMFINFGENFPLARLVDTRHLISTLEYKDLWRPWSLDPVPTLYPLHTLWFLLGVPYI